MPYDIEKLATEESNGESRPGDASEEASQRRKVS
jgi:hypothetical protein